MIGDFVKKQRLKRDITQAEVALRLGISRPTYIQIELGGRDITVPEVKKLAELFDMSPEDFINETEPAVPKVILEKGDLMEKAVEENSLEIRVPRQDLEKLEQVLLYVLTKVGGKPNVGETVLHKLLYFIDFDYYEKFEENLMGLTYIKNHHGPTSVELGEVIKKMIKDEEVQSLKVKRFNYVQKKYLAINEPDLKLLSAQELLHIDDVLNRLSDKSAGEIEEYSHGDIPWIVAKEGKQISYEAVFYREDPYSVRAYDEL